MLETIRYLIGSPGPSGFGSKSTGEEVTASCCLNSVTAIITGATSGIGEETARVLAKGGARLVIPARNLKAAGDLKSRIQKEVTSAEIILIEMDLSSFASIKGFVAEFLSQNLPLNILINNAGKFCHRFHLSKDGYELTFATNHLGHFLLTRLLLNKMVETAEKTGMQGRIVNVSSAIHRWTGKDGIQYDRLNDHTRFNATRAYSQSKLANILHTTEIARRLKERKANVTVNALHPGIVKTRITRERDGLLTDIVFFLASKLLKTVPQAASTTCYVAVHPQLRNISGKYFADCNEAQVYGLANDTEKALELWNESEAMVSSFL
eukprot:TRINITY_DN9499_c0_g2_i1.p1 TRINITY_DN9499_c0_g2~~TRINITY_DN9499_c0_g2_i1.p1  ORF type:complete len:323 (+),score=24.45 TRINITY_DN9499_c0_g2_i1:83-1051(+)